MPEIYGIDKFHAVPKLSFHQGLVGTGYLLVLAGYSSNVLFQSAILTNQLPGMPSQPHRMSRFWATHEEFTSAAGQKKGELLVK